MKSLTHFQTRRKQVFDQMPDNSLALLSAAPTQYRNSDTEYPFRQESYFYYLTGFEESFAIAVLLKKQGQCRFILFCQDKDPAVEQWTGIRAGTLGAREKYGADEAYSIAETALRFPDLFLGTTTIYYLISTNPAFDKKLFSWINALRKKTRSNAALPHRFLDFRVILDEMRLIKAPEEIAALRQACNISVEAHLLAMQQAKPGMYEYELEATLLHQFCRQGARAVAYPSIVAGGENACILHYTRNDKIIGESDLVLIDAGAEYLCYAADLTRTFPIKGKFTAAQQAIYELVLAAQTTTLALLSPQITWDKLQANIIQTLVQGLVDLKILRGNPDLLIEENAYLPFYMHNSGHWLGLDVHDVGDYKVAGKWRPLRHGMVFTVEPGLYFSPANLKIPEKFRGIGIRIEDDILLTEQGFENLTAGAPKTIADIQHVMQK